ncbi:hypothetical protein DSO57_1017088 [Entomophthora muscae]|uniref:Uncharacterized protein n=1 Tax=Entomophthora muscae TaxID=34485 RepID=A0ACC2STV3_9FUNG|nr:hypothetical protein DSO57_1017088 [Entomophthora muscae]
MHPVVGLLRYIPYNLILSQIITGRWGPAVGNLLSTPPNVHSVPANLGVVPPVFKTENLVVSRCPEFYSEDTLMLSQAIYLWLLFISFGNFTKRYLKLCWWLIINSMWIWVVIPHHLETASYYPSIFITDRATERGLHISNLGTERLCFFGDWCASIICHDNSLDIASGCG